MKYNNVREMAKTVMHDDSLPWDWDPTHNLSQAWALLNALPCHYTLGRYGTYIGGNVSPMLNNAWCYECRITHQGKIIVAARVATFVEVDLAKFSMADQLMSAVIVEGVEKVVEMGLGAE